VVVSEFIFTLKTGTSFLYISTDAHDLPAKRVQL